MLKQFVYFCAAATLLSTGIYAHEIAEQVQENQEQTNLAGCGCKKKKEKNDNVEQIENENQCLACSDCKD